jgi:hypothetical protein
MRRGANRRSAMKVRGGRVARKNNWAPNPNDHMRVDQPFPLIVRERPGFGHRHLLRRRQVRDFCDLLPEWGDLSLGLNAIVLAEGELGVHGWHLPGTVALCAWDESVVLDHDPAFHHEHADIIERLGVRTEAREDDYGGFVRTWWTEPTARAFQLLHILLHEFGHHHDRMTTASLPDYAPRGEPYAEAYARRHEAVVWDRYLERFGLD